MAGLLDLWVVPALLALVPAAYRLWRGRRMAAFAADAVLPERLAASRNPLIAVFAAAATLLFVVWEAHRWWSLPVMLMSFLAAGWPLRRVLFGETWNLGAYLWFYVRLIVVIYGFWLLLMVAPWLTTVGGDPRWPVVAVLAVVLIAWNRHNSAIVRGILGAQPIVVPSLTERFSTIIGRSKIPAPIVDYVDLRGGVIVNAIALPDAARPGVLFSSSLIERLDEREVAAIFAHEMAHLEHFNRAYLAKLRWSGWAIIAAALLVGPLVSTYAPQSLGLRWLWPLVVFAYSVILTQHRQKHETESDLRAVALSGDPDALISGLVKLHELAKLPRRMDPNVEATASHPSLARRVQAIREAAQLTAATLDAPVTLTSGAQSVTLHPTRLEWRESNDAVHSLAYSSLADLRIDADNKGITRITASDPQGRRWTMPLAAEDVRRAQAALDVVDARVRPVAGTGGLQLTVTILVALLCVVSGAATGQYAAWIVTAIAVFSPERPMIRAAGVSCLVGAAVALRETTRSEFALILLLSAGLLLFLGSRDRRTAFLPRTWHFVNAVGLLALVSAIPYALSFTRLISLHQAARQWPTAAVLALAFAAANAMRARRYQPLTVVALMAGVAIVVLGETRTLDVLLGDPFLERSTSRQSTPLAGEPASAFAVDFVPTRLMLSPGGEGVAVVEEDEHERSVFHVGRPGGTLIEVSADDALFVDDRRLLLVLEGRDTTSVSLVDVDRPAHPLWQHSLDVSFRSLAINRGATRWRLLADDYGAIVAVSGSLDGGPPETQRWNVEWPEQASLSPLAVTGSRLLIGETRYEGFGGSGFDARWLSFVSRPRTTTTFTIVDGSARSELFASTLYVSCEASRDVDEGPVCSANDGTRTHLARLNATDGTLTPLALFHTFARFDPGSRWITGWSRGPFVLDLEGDALITVDRASGLGNRAIAMAAAEGVVAAAFTNPGEPSATVRFYRPPAAAADTR